MRYNQSLKLGKVYSWNYSTIAYFSCYKDRLYGDKLVKLYHGDTVIPLEITLSGENSYQSHFYIYRLLTQSGDIAFACIYSEMNYCWEIVKSDE